VLKKLGVWAVKKVGEGPLRRMAENSTRKLDIKVGRKSEGSSRKEKSTRESNQFLNKTFYLEFVMEVNTFV
jgi:hypothetical protein